MDEEEKEKNMRSHSQISPFIADVIRVVVAIIVALSITLWLGGMLGQFTVIEDIKVNINTNIYNPGHNIGILNEEVVFNIYIINYENFTRMINIELIAEDYFEMNRTLNLEAMESMNVSITEKLIYPGIWTIKVLDEDKKVRDGYSFLVAINKGEANIKVSQWNDIQFNKWVSLFALVLAVIGLIPDIIKFVKKVRAQVLSGDAPHTMVETRINTSVKELSNVIKGMVVGTIGFTVYLGFRAVNEFGTGPWGPDNPVYDVFMVIGFALMIGGPLIYIVILPVWGWWRGKRSARGG